MKKSQVRFGMLVALTKRVDMWRVMGKSRQEDICDYCGSRRLPAGQQERYLSVGTIGRITDEFASEKGTVSVQFEFRTGLFGKWGEASLDCSDGGLDDSKRYEWIDLRVPLRNLKVQTGKRSFHTELPRRGPPSGAPLPIDCSAKEMADCINVWLINWAIDTGGEERHILHLLQKQVLAGEINLEEMGPK